MPTLRRDIPTIRTSLPGPRALRGWHATPRLPPRPTRGSTRLSSAEDGGR